MPWDCVEVGLAGVEETISFGPRHETGSSLYQVDTLANVSPREKSNDNPRVLASLSQDGFCVTVSSQVLLFNSNCTILQSKFDFECEIDTIAWSDDSTFLAVGERSGEFHFIHVPTKQILFSQELVSPQSGFRKNDTTFKAMVFTLEETFGSHSLVILSSGGKLFCFTNLKLGELHEAIEAQCVEDIKNNKEGIQLDCVDTGVVHNDWVSGVTDSIFGGAHSILSAGKGEMALAVWAMKGLSNKSLLDSVGCFNSEGAGFIKCCASDDDTFVVVLDEMNTLSLWDMKSLNMVLVWPDIQVKDFILLHVNNVQTPGGGRSDNEYKLVILTQPLDEKCYLQVYSLPVMEQVYSRKVSRHCYLSVSPSHQETIYFIEGMTDDITPSENDAITGLKIRCLTEALPENRLYRLLNKQQFDTAVVFARQFQLDVELVFKVKANFVLDKVSPWSNKNQQAQVDSEEEFCPVAELKKCFANITDDSYVVNCCLQSTLSTIEETFELLSYARNRVSQTKPSASDLQKAIQSHLSQEVLEALDRFATFEMAFGTANFSGSRWQQFRGVDLLGEVNKCLERGEIASAVVVWERHQSRFEANFTVEKLELVLGSVHQDMQSSMIIPWLRDDFIPFVVKVLPEGQESLARWLGKRARNMELSEKEAWPANALEFASLLSSACRSVSGCAVGRGLATPAQFVNQVCGLPTIASAAMGNNVENQATDVQRLLVLVQQLTDLVDLHTKYGCKISLSDYSQETTSTIVFRLLDKVMVAELIPNAIEKQVGPYMANHGLNRDKMLLEYVKDMFNKVAGSYSSLSNSLWEARVIAVISCIRDKEARCHSALEVMRHTLAPWSEAVEKLIKEVMENYPNNTELVEQYRLVELKKMLRQYGLRSRQVSYPAKSLIRVILTKDTPTSIKDALQVAAAFSHVSKNEVYSFRVQHLCSQDRIPECLQLLNSLPSRDAAEIAQETVTWLCGILEDRCLKNDDREQKMMATQAAIAILRFIDNHDLSTDHNARELKTDLRRISSLQSEFGEFTSVDQLQDAEKRENIFQKYLNRYISSEERDIEKEEVKVRSYNQKKKKRLTKMSLPQFLRLSELVGIQRDEARERLVLKTFETKNFEGALDICRELYEKSPSAQVARTLYRVAHKLCQQLADVCSNRNKISGVTQKIHQLLSHAVILCTKDLMCDILELCKCCGIADAVFSQCESGDYDFSVQNTAQSSRKDPLAEWSFGARFKEDGLVLDSFVALPLAGKFNLACVPDCNCQENFHPSRVSGRPSVPKACDNKAIESGEETPQASHLVLVSQAGLNIIRHLQENSLNELALRYAIQTIGVCLQHYATNSLSLGLSGANEEKKDIPESEVIEKQTVTTILEMGHQIITELIGTLLMKVFTFRTVDHDLGLGYVCSTPKQLALKKLESSGMHFLGQSHVKILAYSKVGVDFSMLCDEAVVLESCKAIATNAAWGIKLRNVKVPFKDAVYKLDGAEKLKLLTELIKHPEVDLDLITEFCRSFMIDEDKALLMYIKFQLLPSDTRLHSQQTQEDTVADEIFAYEKITEVIKSFTEVDTLLPLLQEVVTQVDPYDYERIRFILEHICSLSEMDTTAAEKGIQLIEYLDHYDRHAPPGCYEKSYSCQEGRSGETDKMALEKEEIALSTRSKHRLPYHPLLYGDPWKIIAPELTEETVPKLLGVAKLLKLSSDKLYLTAIKNMFESSAGATQGFTVSGRRQSDEERAAVEKVKAFEFEKAKTILYAIKSKEMATAAANWIAQQLPLGEEQITVLRTCVNLADEWKTNCKSEQESEKAKSSHSCLLKLSRGVATEHVLHKYAIGEPSVVTLVSQPAKLICKLYEKYGARDLVANTSAADIHRATDEIAAINNSNVSKIRLHLLEKWLPSVKNTSQSSPGPVPSMLSVDCEENVDEDEKNLKRVIYLVRNNELEHSTRFLLNYAYKMSSSTITSQCRMRALRALFAIALADSLQQISQKPVESIRHYMQSLVCLAELEGLHIQQSLSAFQKCNKEGLVRGLWRNHHHEKRAVRLVADLSLDNGIYDVQLWNSVLQQLLAFGMIRYLRRVLGCLAGVSTLWQVPCLPQVWRSVLMAPFKSVSPPLSDSELAACEDSAALLQRCPLLLDLDVSAMAFQFHKVGLFAHSLACLLLIPNTSDRKKKIKALLDTGCAVTILDQVTEQKKKGRTLTRSDVIQHEVYGYIEETRSYQVLLTTNHFDDFVQHLVCTKNIDGLLMTTLKADRLDEAMQLVRLYHRIHTDSPSARYTLDNNLPAFEELWAYLDINRLLEEAMPYLPQPETEADTSELTQQDDQECTDMRSDQYGWTEPTGETHSILQHSSHIMYTGDYSIEFPL